jgi:hypothetical protein
MRASKQLVIMTVCVLVVAGMALAGNMPGVADVQKINFLSPIRIGTTLVRQGNYEVRHVMEGQDHIMVFRALDQKKVPEVRIKCTLVPLAEKAKETQKIYTVNTAKEEVLQELIFRGDTAKHVFQ